MISFSPKFSSACAIFVWDLHTLITWPLISHLLYFDILNRLLNRLWGWPQESHDPNLSCSNLILCFFMIGYFGHFLMSMNGVRLTWQIWQASMNVEGFILISFTASSGLIIPAKKVSCGCILNRLRSENAMPVCAMREYMLRLTAPFCSFPPKLIENNFLDLLELR